MDELSADPAAGALEAPAVLAGAVVLAEGLEVRASLTRWGGRERAHLRTWYRAASGRWCPTRRGVTVLPEQLGDLEAAVRALREACAAGEPGSPTAA